MGEKINNRTVNDAGTRENVGSPVVQQSRIRCFNCKEFGHFAKECRKPKRVKDSAYHKEKMLLYKQAEQGVPLQTEQYDWLADTDEEIDEQELKAHYSYMKKIQEVPTADSGTDSEPLEQLQIDTRYNVFANNLQHSEQSESNDQNDVESDDERVALANLIANLKLDVEENKKIQKQLKKANTTLAQKLKECKTILAETSKTLGESISVWDSCLVAFQNKQTEFKKYKAFNDRTVDYDKLERKLNDTLGQLAQKDIEIKEDLKAQLQDKNITIIELKKLIEKGKGKSMETKFDKPSVVRQPNAQRIPKPSVLGKPAPFLDSLERRYFPKTKSVPKTNVSEGLSKPFTAPSLPQTARQAIIKLILVIFDYGCMKHITGNLKLLCNFVEKFLGTVRFGNDQFAPILGYEDLVQGNITINRVYYFKGLNHNLFSVGQFCDADLEVAFRKSTWFFRDLQGNDLLTDAHVPSQQELDLLFGHLYNEFFNIGSNPQDKQPTMNIQPTSAPSTPTYLHAEEKNNDQAVEEHLQDDEFTNPFCAPAQEVAESSSHNIGNSNVPTFNQPQVSKYQWTKDHPLEQVRRNPSRPVQTRQKLATDPEMCMFALTVSTTEPKNIKEAMANSAWIEAMQKELH
nr:integrase, catalytic region, zinc finger, CCHC-type, peptidase aspartic, catalytic [Tanacetum cinerariifolium]